MKVFKSIPKMDLEMLLPGGRVQMGLVDRGRIILPAASGLAVGWDTITRRVPTWMKNSRYNSTTPPSVCVRTATKSLAHSVAACR